MWSPARSTGSPEVTVTREAVLEALKTVIDPASGQDIVAAGAMRALNVEDGTVRFVLEVAADRATAYEATRAEAEAAVLAMDGVTSASVILTAHSTQKAPPDLKPGAPRCAAGA